ncbi:MAG: hypothetical protein IJ400_05370 [Clostridia bacterium]|nr:hypothetical protein [Clostridia bacterium]
MKYKVIGWTWYDNELIEEMDHSDSATEAVIEDIRANGYLFSGMHHQDYPRCAPVLNNGKMLTFTQRGFGGVMAKAYGKTSRMSYAEYAFDWHFGDEDSKTPYVFPKEERVFEGEVDKSLIETDLSESFEYEATKEEYENAVNNGTLEFIYKNEKYRFMDTGDTILVKCQGQECLFEITSLARYKKFTEDEQIELIMGSPLNPDAEKKADELYESKPETIEMKLKKI